MKSVQYSPANAVRASAAPRVRLTPTSSRGYLTFVAAEGMDPPSHLLAQWFEVAAEVTMRRHGESATGRRRLTPEALQREWPARPMHTPGPDYALLTDPVVEVLRVEDLREHTIKLVLEMVVVHPPSGRRFDLAQGVFWSSRPDHPDSPTTSCRNYPATLTVLESWDQGPEDILELQWRAPAVGAFTGWQHVTFNARTLHASGAAAALMEFAESLNSAI